jgi:hypothetical protein
LIFGWTWSDRQKLIWLKFVKFDWKLWDLNDTKNENKLKIVELVFVWIERIEKTMKIVGESSNLNYSSSVEFCSNSTVFSRIRAAAIW